MNLQNLKQEYFYSGEWHIHTDYTDGKNNIDDYCQEAIILQIPLLAFTEHVRKGLEYDFNNFITDIEKARTRYPQLIILKGCEAKVLSNGTLDCKDEILIVCDYVVFAYHSLPDDPYLFFESLHKTILNNKVNTWGHPGFHFQIKSFDDFSYELQNVFTLLKEKEISLEINYKHKLPQLNWIEQYKNTPGANDFVFGSDVHSIEQLRASCNYKRKMLSIWKERQESDFVDWITNNYNNK